MVLSRKRRSSKVVDYAALENQEIDVEIFDGIVSPSKKKETKKGKENDENVKSRGLKKRLSVEERKFQRELEMALELSSFQGFNKEVCGNGDLETFSPLRDTDAVANPHQDFSNGPSGDVEATEEVHNISNVQVAVQRLPSVPHAFDEDEESKCSLSLPCDAKSPQNIESNENTSRNQTKEETNLQSLSSTKVKESSIYDDPMPGTSDGFTAKRQRKKVNFAEEDSDSWSEDFKDSESEGDESDFFPSPTKKKSKKLKSSPKKKNVKPPPPKKSKSRETKDIKSDTLRTPLKPKQILSAHSPKLSEVPKSSSPVSSKPSTSVPKLSSPKGRTLKGPSTPVNSPDAVISLINSNSSKSCIPNIEKKSVGLVKKPFKSPNVGVSPRTPSQGLSTPPRIGLRLGLSRNSKSKPLHPKASLKT